MARVSRCTAIPRSQKFGGADGVHLSAGGDPLAVRALLGPDKLIGVSIHTMTEAEAIDPGSRRLCAGGAGLRDAEQAWLWPRDRPQGPGRDRTGSRVPVLAIGGLNAARAAEVLAAGPVGIAVMGGIMRAADPGQEMRALVATIMGRSAVSSGWLDATIWGGRG